MRLPVRLLARLASGTVVLAVMWSSGSALASPTYTITATAGPNGTVSPIGDVVVDSMGSQEFTFLPDEGYFVYHVFLDGVDLGAQPNLTAMILADVVEDRTLHVTFTNVTCTLLHFPSPSDAGVTTAIPVSGPYPRGTTVQLFATPLDGNEFLGWLTFAPGVLEIGFSPANPLGLTLDSFFGTEWTAIGYFGMDPHTCMASPAPDGAGSVTRNPDLPLYGTNTDIQLTAQPNPGWEFRSWCGNYCGTVNPVTIRTPSAASIVAIFAESGAPTVQVTQPNSADKWCAIGFPMTFEWIAGDAEGIESVDLYVSWSGPTGPWAAVATGIPNSGSFSWTPTGPATDAAFLKVVAHNPPTPGQTGMDISDARFRVLDITGVDTPESPLNDFDLRIAFANPTQGEAKFLLSLPTASSVRLDIFDVQGRVVATPLLGQYPAGTRVAQWNGRSVSGPVASGIYFYRCSMGTKRYTGRIVIAR